MGDQDRELEPVLDNFYQHMVEYYYVEVVVDILLLAGLVGWLIFKFVGSPMIAGVVPGTSRMIL